jgi:hypothetical protein
MSDIPITYTFYDAKYVVESFGLTNLGNTCWFNSMVQVLFSLPSFNKFMLDNEVSLREKSKLAAAYLDILHAIFDTIDQPMVDVRPKLSPTELQRLANDKSAMAMQTTMFQPKSTSILPGHQRIAAPPRKGAAATQMYSSLEPFTLSPTQQKNYILSTASSKLSVALVIEARAKKLTLNITDQEGVANGLTVFLDSLNDDRVYTVFNTKYEGRIYCTFCHKMVSSMSDMACIINVHSQKKIETEQDLVNYIMKHPTLAEDYKCELCGNKMIQTNRVYNLRLLRDVIILLFDRFHSANNRWFPPELRFVSRFNTVLTYKLVGQSEHSGSLDKKTYNSSGHWWAKCLRRDGNAYTLNDSSVSPGKLEPTPNTHLVAYHIVSETATN